MELIYLEPTRNESPEDYASRCDKAISGHKEESYVISVGTQCSGISARLELSYSNGRKCCTPELSESHYICARPVFYKHLNESKETA